MEILLLTVAFFGIAIFIMSLGVMFKRKPIQGSCGGIANIMGGCDFCHHKSECTEKLKH